jgi:hypothetical protein
MMGLSAIIPGNKAFTDTMSEVGSGMASLGIKGALKSDEDIIRHYVKVCRHVRKGCNFDI